MRVEVLVDNQPITHLNSFDDTCKEQVKTLEDAIHVIESKISYIKQLNNPNDYSGH